MRERTWFELTGPKSRLGSGLVGSSIFSTLFSTTPSSSLTVIFSSGFLTKGPTRSSVSSIGCSKREAASDLSFPFLSFRVGSLGSDGISETRPYRETRED